MRVSARVRFEKCLFFFFQAEDGIRDIGVTGVQTCALPILIPRMAGYALASELLLFGEPFDAATALRAGIINKVVPAESLQEVAAERARTLASRPAEAVRVTKELIRGPRREETHATLAREGAQFIERLGSQEAQEAFMAFMSRGSKK